MGARREEGEPHAEHPGLIRPEDVAAYARTLAGTPYRHEGREPGYWLDCVGVLTATAQHFGCTFHDLRGYSRWATDDTLLRELDKCLIRVEEELRIGHILAFQIGKRHMHGCVVVPYFLDGELGMVHALSQRRRVVEHILDLKWRRRIVATYRLPGVEY